MSPVKDAADKPKDEVKLLRQPGMQAVPLQTGFYGVDGKRIKHQVHKGALQLPPEALNIYEEEKDGKEQNQFNLPPLDYVKRPSLDEHPCVQTIIRRHELVEESINPLDGTLQRVMKGSTVIRNELLKKEKSDPPAARIRGGGDEPLPPQDPPQAPSAAPAVTSHAEGDAPTAPPVPVPTSTPNPPVVATSDKSNAPNVEAPSQNTTPVAAAPQPSQPQLSVPASLPAVSQTTPAAPSTVQQKVASQPPSVTGSIPVPPSNLPLASSVPVATSKPPVVGSIPMPPSVRQPAPPSVSAVPEASAVKPEPSLTSIADSKVAPTIPTVPSATTIPQEKKPDPPEPNVVALKKQPASQWEQRSASAEELAKAPKPGPKPDWYKKDEASDLERSILPEWFDGSAKHRTLETFLETREKIIAMATKINRYLTSTLLRRAIPGDSGSLIRLHRFLSSYGLINEKNHGTDSAPTPEISIQASGNMRKRVLDAVSDQVNAKKARMDDGKPIVDWKAVAASVQNGMSASSCERMFLSNAQSNGTTDAPLPSFVDELIQRSDSKVVSAAINAALEASDDVHVAQAASVAGLAVAATEGAARAQEDSVARIMSEIVDLRMQKLEERMQILDDAEEMLESERLALSLERRDLYTARCRHWFGKT